MPNLYYAVRETDSYENVVLHADRDCFDGPARAAPSTLIAEGCPDCLDTDEGEESNEMHDRDIEQLIDAGECPWCDDYEGEHVGQHASSAHPEKWAAYSE